MESKSTNGLVQLQDSRRRLPVGEIQVRSDRANFPAQLDEFEQIPPGRPVPGARFERAQSRAGYRRAADLRRADESQVRDSPCRPGHGAVAWPGLAGRPWWQRKASVRWNFTPIYDETTVAIGDARVPLEMDLTTFRAYTLSQSRIWSLGKLGFLAPAERIPSQLILNQPYRAGPHTGGARPRHLLQPGHLGGNGQHADGGPGTAQALSGLEFRLRQRQSAGAIHRAISARR